MGSETRIVCLIFVLFVHELRETSAGTRCYECGTTFTPYCEDPIFLKSTLTYEPTLCSDLIKDDKFASKVITRFMTYMTDDTEEMSGMNSVSGKADQRRRRRRATAVSWLDRIAPALRITHRSKRQILNSLPGNWSSRQDSGKVAAEPQPGKDPDGKEEDDQEKTTVEADSDDFKCYKLVFANQRDELEEFRGCALIPEFDVCDLLINYNEKSQARVVFCELCHNPLVDKEHPPCNDASIFNSINGQTFIYVLSGLFIILTLL